VYFAAVGFGCAPIH